MSIKNLLETRIQEQIEGLDNYSPEQPEYKESVKAIDTLLGRAIEIEKFDHDSEVEKEIRKQENISKKQQEKINKRFRIAELAIEGGIAIANIILVVWGTRKSLKFEETGTFTTLTGRGFIQKLLPKK